MSGNRGQADAGSGELSCPRKYQGVLLLMIILTGLLMMAGLMLGRTAVADRRF